MSMLDYETKDKPAAMLKFDAAAGSGTAKFSTYYVEDADGDYTEAGAMPHGKTVPFLVAHSWGELPRGKGRIRSEPDGAYYDFTLADTPRGRELSAWLRFDMADGQPRSEFSYGFKILEGGASRRMIGGKSLRVLHARPDGSEGLQVLEISYVLKGAGVSTSLISMKGEQRYHWDRRHAELTAILKEHQRSEQAEIQQLYAKFTQREREMRR